MKFDFDQERIFTNKRGRFRLNAFWLRPWLKGDFVRNLRFLMNKLRLLQFKVGLQKSDYRRERIIYSRR